MKKKKYIHFNSSHLSSEVALTSPVTLTDHTLRDTTFLHHYCWFKSSEILCRQLRNSYWCFEGSYCRHPLTVKKKALQSSKPLANIYHSTRHDIPEAWNIRLHSSQIGAKKPQSFMSTSTFSETVAHTYMWYTKHTWFDDVLYGFIYIYIW